MEGAVWTDLLVLGTGVGAPLQHGSGVDDVACIGIPLLILIAVVWFTRRRGAQQNPDDPDDLDDPRPEG